MREREKERDRDSERNKMRDEEIMYIQKKIDG